MGRKSNYVSKITSKDARMLLAFSRTGYLSKDMLQGRLGIAERRIQSFQRDKLLDKGTYFNPKTKTAVEVYRLSEKGQKFITKNLGTDRFYRSSSAAHDLTLSDKYLSLSPSEQDSWIIESQVRDMFSEMVSNLRDNERQDELWRLYENHQISCIDACYTDADGRLAGIEVTTSAYGEAEIAAKEELSDALGIDTLYIKI